MGSRVTIINVLVGGLLVALVLCVVPIILHQMDTASQEKPDEVEEIEVVDRYLENCRSNMSENLYSCRAQLSTIEDAIEALEELVDYCPERNEEMKAKLFAMKMAVDALQKLLDSIENEVKTLDVELILANYTK